MTNISHLSVLAVLTTFVAIGQSVPMHTCIVGGEIRLCSDMPVVSVASATTTDANVKFERVNGGWVKTTTTVTPPSASPAPAPKPVASVVRHSAPPAPRPVVQASRVLTPEEKELTAATLELIALMKENITARVTPSPLAQVSATPTSSLPSGLSQQIVDRLVDHDKRLNELATAQNKQGDRLTTAEDRLVILRDNQNSDHELLLDTGAATLTGSRHDKCQLYRKMLAGGGMKEGANPPKGCKP